MKILFFGDIVGEPGRRAVKKILPQWQEKYCPDAILANAENLAHGSGITEKSLNEILEAGVDLLTSGNHIFDKKEAWSLLENKNFPLTRPANWSQGVPGQGYRILTKGLKKILAINLSGRLFMKEALDCPFREADRILEEFQDEKINAIIVDFHAEATSEKKSLGYYLDGRVAAVLGTHTHIPTADARILSGGTAYISDVGMVGVSDSVLGVKKEIALKGFLTQIYQRLEVAEGTVEIDAVLLETNDKTGLAKSIERLEAIVELN